MANNSIKTGKRHKKDPIEEKDLQGFKRIHEFLPMLKRFHLIRANHNTDLHFDQYISLVLFFFFNPVLTSLRGIQQASHLEKVKKVLGIKGTSLGSLSEASNIFDANLLAPLIKELAEKAILLEKDPKLKSIQQAILAVDGSLLPALPKMLWALWLDDQHRAAKLHLEFNIFKSVPTNAIITDGNGNEKTALREFLSSDKLYVFDAGYREYKLLQDIITANSSFVMRLQDNAVYDIIEQRPLTDDDKKAGVQRDMTVRLGCKDKQGDLTQQVRVIEIFHKGDSSRRQKTKGIKQKDLPADVDYTFLLVTDRMDLSAEVIALIYRYRWQVELFFRWFKCILNCTHLISHSKNGVSIQVYCALIASMLITIWTGCKPNKRTFEMLCFYFSGWASEEELAQHIQKLKQVEDST